jgi:hypothetical protein
MPKFCIVGALPLTFTTTVDPAGTLTLTPFAVDRSVPETSNTFNTGSVPVRVMLPNCTVVVPFAGSAASSAERPLRNAASAPKSITWSCRAVPFGMPTPVSMAVPP